MLVLCWPTSIVRTRIRKTQPISCESSPLKTSTLRLKLSYNWCSTIIRWFKPQISQEQSLYGTLLRQGMGIEIINPIKFKKVKKNNYAFYHIRSLISQIIFFFMSWEKSFISQLLQRKIILSIITEPLGKSIQQMTGVWLNECFSRPYSGYHLVYNLRLSR